MELTDNTSLMFLGMLFVGIALAVAFLLLIAMGRLWNRVYAWIDDSEPAKHNPLTVFLMKRWGCKPCSHGHDYQNAKGESVRAEEKLPPFGFGLVVAPAVLFMAIKFYPVTLTVATLILLAHLARFAFRTKKLISKHLADPHAHK